MNFRKYRFIMLSALVLIMLPLAASAIPLNNAANIASNNQLATETTATGFLSKILQGLLTLAFIIAVIFVVISGYRMITSVGNPEQVAAAKKQLFWAIAGVVVIFLSLVILQIVVRIAQTGNP